MEWKNYFSSISKKYRIEINQTLQNTIKEYFEEIQKIYTEQDMYESHHKIIHDYYQYIYGRYLD